MKKKIIRPKQNQSNYKSTCSAGANVCEKIVKFFMQGAILAFAVGMGFSFYADRREVRETNEKLERTNNPKI